MSGQVGGPGSLQAPHQMHAKKYVPAKPPSDFEIFKLKAGGIITGALTGKGPIWQQILVDASLLGVTAGLGGLLGKGLKAFSASKLIAHSVPTMSTHMTHAGWVGTAAGAAVAGAGLTAARVFLPSMGPKVMPATQSRVDNLFSDMKKNFVAEATVGYKATYRFDLTGKFGGVWTVVVDNGKFDIQKGIHGKADAIFHAKAADWLAITEDKLDGTKAFIAGRLRIDGDIAKALRLEEIFP